MNEAGTALGKADPDFVWTEDTLTLTARADLATAILRREARVTDEQAVRLTGEEALLWVLSDSTPAELEQELAERRERVTRTVVGVLPGEERPERETRAEAARRRYASNPEYREKVKADMRRRRDTDEFRAKERERKRKARAAQRAAKS